MKICRTLIFALPLLPLIWPSTVLSQTLPAPPPSTIPQIYAEQSAYAATTPVTVAAKWQKPPTFTRRVIQPQVQQYLGRGVSSGNCVSTLQMTGLMRQGKVTKDGFARTIPVKPLKLKEGEKAVIRTAEGPLGHVLQVKLEKGKYVSTVEGGYKNGVGRVVNPAVIQGEVSL